MFVSSFSFSIGFYLLLPALSLSLFFTRVHRAGFRHHRHRPWVLFLVPPFLQCLLIASPSQSLTSWLVGLHCLIHLFLVSLSFWTFFVVYLLAYHTGILPADVLYTGQGPLHHTKGQSPFSCCCLYSANVVNNFIPNCNNHHHIVVINVLYSFVNFCSGVSSLPESSYLFYCSDFSGLVPGSSVSTPAALVFLDACASFSTSIFSGTVSDSTTGFGCGQCLSYSFLFCQGLHF